MIISEANNDYAFIKFVEERAGMMEELVLVPSLQILYPVKIYLWPIRHASIVSN
jgi:hypothetical protein